MKFPLATISLGVTMTIGYGTLYYSFSVLAPEIAGEFGWSRSFVFGVFSFGLLAGAVAAPVIGRLVDRLGARLVLCLGSVAAALALALFAVMQNAWHFALITLAAEFVALAVQYDAGFAALAQSHGREARAHITLVTLIAGFASTIYWPLLQWLLTVMTWREIYLVLAAMNLLLALPIHLALPKTRIDTGEPAKPVTGAAKDCLPADRSRQMVLMAIAFAAGGFVISAIGATLLVLMRDLGYATGIATLAGSLIGPSQVAARLIEYVRRNLFSPPLTAIIAAVVMALGIILLAGSLLIPATGFALAFALFYGAGQGLTSIVRGVLPLHYFGVVGYGRTMGTLSAVRIVVSAIAPVSVIWLNDVAGPAAALASLALASLAAVLATLALTAGPRLKTAL
ncbi:MFS transporter [Rhizobium sp. Root274]|uniref:MFS transporter n=1 Tax=unclassified Rhizobium TaxID=2613769 RepID=UPI0007150AA6|nr:MULTISPECIES: MFS transporter [unclassified Rhizobium]KQW32032.1 MFS transporter [Rhizobium sp. Root1240]KRD33569.1 MFS transporter [Rhizobium sp. Root274]